MNKQTYQQIKGKFGKEFTIPNDWEQVRIGDTCELISGATPRTENPEYYDGVIPWINSGELDYNIITHTHDNITKEAVRATNLKIHPVGTFLVAIAGLEARGTRGRCAILGIPATTNQSCMAFYPNEKVISNYLFYYWQQFSEKIIFSLAQGTKQQSLNKTLIESIKIEIPPLQEQQKITLILSNIDSLITKFKKNHELNTKFEKELVDKLLSNGINHSKFKESQIEKIPSSWDVVTIKDVSTVKGGKRLPKGESLVDYKTEYPYIRVTDFKNNSVDVNKIKFLTPKTFEKIKRYVISSDDVYISIAGTIGLVGSIPNNLNGANLTENAAKLCNLQNIDKNFLLTVLGSTSTQKQIQSYLGKTSQPKLALFRIEKLIIPLPPLDEQKKITGILNHVRSKIQLDFSYLTNLHTLKKGLMQQLLTGEIRVKV